MDNKRRLKAYLKEFPIFIEIMIFIIFLMYHIKYNKEVSLLVNRALKFRKKKKISKYKLDAVVVFTDYILHNVTIGRNTCLNRTLILLNFLNRMGEEVVIHFGVRKDNNSLTGHSWLTKGKKVFLEKGETYRAFKPIVSFSNSGGVVSNFDMSAPESARQQLNN